MEEWLTTNALEVKCAQLPTPSANGGTRHTFTSAVKRQTRHIDSGYVPTLVRSFFLLVDLMSGQVKVLNSVHHNVKHDLHHSVTVKQDYLSQLEKSRT